MNDNVNAILDGLNDEQKNAVETVDGAVLIVAGAGSGKTRVLTSRIAYLLAQGTDAREILALTFTKKAAMEMKDRITQMVGPFAARRLVMGTFHSVFVRFLREYSASIGYPSDFTIYDTSDSTSAIKACIKQLGLDDKAYKPREILSRISLAKNNLITHGAYCSNPKIAEEDFHRRRPRTGELYSLYQEKLKQSAVMDFDDILLNMNRLLKDDSEALAALAGRFRYIMVDEYQDTNYSQYLILRKLSSVHGNICVVGDDSQSIYAFRGAKIENILNFRKDHPGCRIFRLERNYRSTSTIVSAANSLIAHNKGRIPKECYAVGGRGEALHILRAYNEQEEAVNVVASIMGKMRDRGAEYSDFAILYRTNSQSRIFEDQLRRRNIPYMIYSGNSFFERAEIKDMMAYFKLAVNTRDGESFRRVVNKPARGIGDTTAGRVEALAREKGISLVEAGLEFPKVKPFSEMILRMNALAPAAPAQELARFLADESGLYAAFKADNSIEGRSRLSNLEELVNSVALFEEDRRDEIRQDLDNPEEADAMTVTLADYLENVSLLSNADIDDGEETSNKVSLMTVHSAKGLEFPYIYVVGMEENLFPGSTATANPAELEEERRLFYVAVTRAETTVELSFAGTRFRNGKHESNPPSRFLKEIDPQYIDNPLVDDDFSDEGVKHEWGGFGSRFSGGRMNRFGSSGAYGGSSGAARRSPSPAAPVAAHRSFAPASLPADPDFKGVPVEELHVGQRVEHNRFGAGVIRTMSGTAPDIKAVVNFDRFGEKLLLLKYAKLRPEKK